MIAAQVIGPATILRLRPDIRFRRIADEAIVVCQDAGEVLAINEVGARTLELIDGRRSLGEIARSLSGEYEVALDELCADVLGFGKELAAACIAEESGKVGPPAEG